MIVRLLHWQDSTKPGRATVLIPSSEDATLTRIVVHMWFIQLLIKL